MIRLEEFEKKLLASQQSEGFPAGTIDQADDSLFPQIGISEQCSVEQFDKVATFLNGNFL